MYSIAYSITKESTRGWLCPSSLIIFFWKKKKREIPHPSKISYSTEDDVLTPNYNPNGNQETQVLALVLSLSCCFSFVMQQRRMFPYLADLL